MFYAYVALKLLVGFLCFLAYMNLSGRAQLAPNSAIDQIGNYVLGGIMGGVIYNQDVSVLEMVLIIAIWSALILLMRFIRTRSRKAKSIIDGDSLILFDNGQIQTNALRAANKSARDFVAGMHLHGVHRLDELQTVWLETNGQYTILKKGEEPFPIAIIEDGHLVEESLTKACTKEWVLSELKRQGYQSPSNIVFADWVPAHGDSPSRLTVYPYQ